VGAADAPLTTTTMADIAETYELEFAIQVTVDPAVAEFLLDLAQGLIVDEIGERDPWSPTAKAVALAAAGRAYLNPSGNRSETTGPFTAVRDAAALGVYLTDEEVARLHRQPGATYGPVGSFPAAQCWPDPVRP
jgi:hypothetical protein